MNMRAFSPVRTSALPVSASAIARALLLCCTAAGFAFAHSAAGQANDAAALKPPAGARVAIVEFDDLECPACASANPILKGAAAQYHIPWVRHDFLIPMHNWSRNAAIYARYFDTRDKALGDEYRDQVFANQNSIYNLGMLSAFTQHFAQAHGIALPFEVDPMNRLAAQVQADDDVGKRLGINQTPTIYIVMAGVKGRSWIKVQNPDKDLYQDIDQALAETRR